jgi:hypothetical protein
VTATLSPAQHTEIEAACARLAIDYCHYADNGLTENLAALFTEDGEFHLFGEIHVGPAGVLKGLSARPASIVSVHSLSNHRIEALSETEARSTAYVTVFVADTSAPPPPSIAPFLVGVYRDVYRKTPAGWRLARRAFEQLITKAG